MIRPAPQAGTPAERLDQHKQLGRRLDLHHDAIHDETRDGCVSCGVTIAASGSGWQHDVQESDVPRGNAYLAVFAVADSHGAA